MPTIKTSALVLIAAASISSADVLHLVDDVGPTSYKTNVAQLRTAILQASVGAGWGATDYLGLGAGTVPGSGMIRVGQGTVTVDSPLLHSTATWNAGGVTFKHVFVNVTDTASAVGSLFAEFQLGGVQKWALDKSGNVTQAGTITAPTHVGALAGNASTATVLATARNINGVSFNGSADITVAAAAGTLSGATLAANVLASSLTTVGILAAPHMTAAVVDSGGLTVTAGALTVTAGALTVSVGATSVQALSAASLTLTTAVSKLIPGATSFAIRDNADANDNLGVTNAGNVTVRGTFGAVGDISTGGQLSAGAPATVPLGTPLTLRLGTATAATVGAAGGAAALPATPLGYLRAVLGDGFIGAIQIKIPYYLN